MSRARRPGARTSVSATTTMATMTATTEAANWRGPTSIL